MRMRGLHLNRGKSLLFIPKEADHSQSPLPADIPITRRGFSLLGCPIGPPDFCEEIFQARLTKVRTSLGALRDLGDSQAEITLLRSCLALPKVSFVLRACPPSHIQQSSCDFDQAIRDTLESIVGGPLSDWSWLKAAVMVALIFAVPHYTLQLLFWPLAQPPSIWWSASLVTRLAPHSTPSLP